MFEEYGYTVDKECADTTEECVSCEMLKERDKMSKINYVYICGDCLESMTVSEIAEAVNTSSASIKSALEWA